jgi:TIR domain
MREHHIFLCHSSADKEFVRRLASDLARQGFPVWLDEWELNVGDSLNTKIGSAIIQSGWFAVVLSKNSAKSRWVQKELNAALAHELAKSQTFILPLLLEDCEVPPFLLDKVYADFRGSYQIGLGGVVRSLSPNRLIGATHKVGGYPTVVRYNKLKGERNIRGREKVGALVPGQYVTAVDKAGKWVCVKYIDVITKEVKQGWVLRKYLRVVGESNKQEQPNNSFNPTAS